MNIDRYPRNPLWKRLLFEVVLATSSPIVLLIFFIPFSGSLLDYQLTREALIWTAAVLGGAWLVGFAIAVYLYEIRWEDHPMWFMQKDEIDPDQHESDLRG